jgi:hypothetical protein
MRKVRKIVWQAQAAWKRLASIFKDKWSIDDYPIRVRFQQPTGPVNASRLKLIPWIADVVNWPAMSGKETPGEKHLTTFARISSDL